MRAGHVKDGAWLLSVHLTMKPDVVLIPDSTAVCWVMIEELRS